MDSSSFIDFMELKLMMEKLGEPQTHLALKEMIKTIDEDKDDQISFREVSEFIIDTGRVVLHMFVCIVSVLECVIYCLPSLYLLPFSSC